MQLASEVQLLQPVGQALQAVPSFQEPAGQVCTTVWRKKDLWARALAWRGHGYELHPALCTLRFTLPD